MQELKILHLANDEKFIDLAIKAFEREAPGCNYLLVYGKRPLKFVKTECIVVSKIKAIVSSALDFSRCDIIVIHSLNPIWFRLINSLKTSSTMVWLGWGYDYYDIIFKEQSELLLSETRINWQKPQGNKGLTGNIKSIIKKAVIPDKETIIAAIDIFCPVLPNEYTLTKGRSKSKNFPMQGFWSYGNLEEDLIKGFEGQSVTGKNVLVGNSASAENNHLDTFSLLSAVGIDGREIVSPLSYGNHQYKDFVIRQGKAFFGDRFKPILEFMPIQEYVKTLQSCGFVIMNHLRQQAVGNIVIMLYLGAKVFLNKNSPTFSYLKSQGAVIFTTDELKSSPSMLNQPLDARDVATNRQALAATWSKEVSQRRTRELLSLAASIKK